MHGYHWAVYPQETHLAMVASGVTGTEGAARELVEEVLGRVGYSLLGVVTGPRGDQFACRRARTPGRYVWTPLHEDPSSMPASMDPAQ
jgi:hypothetical protein